MSIIKEEDILKVLISYNPWWRNFEVPKEEVKEMKRKAFFVLIENRIFWKKS